MQNKKALLGFALLVLVFLFYLAISKREQRPPSGLNGEETVPAIANEQAAPDGKKKAEPEKKNAPKQIPEDSTKPVREDSVPEHKLIVTGAVTLEDGYPIAGAKVEMHERKGTDSAPIDRLIVHTTTDDNGHYRLSTGDLLEFLLTASHPSYAKACDYIKDDTPAFPARKKVDVRRITCNLILSAAAPIKGKVLDEKDRPLPKVAVSAVSLERKRVTNKILTICASETDEQGVFAIMDTKAGEHTLCIDHENYVPLRQPVNAPAEGIVLRLESEGASVSGHVYLKSTGEAVPGARVEMRFLLKSSTARSVNRTRCARIRACRRCPIPRRSHTTGRRSKSSESCFPPGSEVTDMGVM